MKRFLVVGAMLAVAAVATVSAMNEVKTSICATLNESLAGLANAAKPDSLGSKLAKLAAPTAIGTPFKDIICPSMIDKSIKQVKTQIGDNVDAIKLLAQLKNQYSCPAYLCVQMPYDIVSFAKTVADKFGFLKPAIMAIANVLQGIIDSQLQPLFKGNTATDKGCAAYYADKLEKRTLSFKGKSYKWWNKTDKNGNPTDPVACLSDDLKKTYHLDVPAVAPLTPDEEQALDALLG